MQQDTVWLLFVKMVKRTKKVQQLLMAIGIFTANKSLSSQDESFSLLDRKKIWICFGAKEISLGFVSCCLLESTHFLTPYRFSLVIASWLLTFVFVWLFVYILASPCFSILIILFCHLYLDVYTQTETHEHVYGGIDT